MTFRSRRTHDDTLRHHALVHQPHKAIIEAVVLTPDEAKTSKAGRKPLDPLVLFRMLVLQALYNLSDEQIEYQVREMMTAARSPRHSQMISIAWDDGLQGANTAS